MSQHDFEKNGYCVIRNAISENIRDFVTQYALFDEMQDNLSGSDDQVPNAHSKYADPAMETVLLLLHQKIEEATGLKLHPTYSYYRVYRPGDDLKPHKDRNECEISATLCFNYNYENYVWPIYMAGNPIKLNPGDMAVYRGCDVEHSREKFEHSDYDTTWQVQGFFHYVDANGPNAHLIFDSRPTIGAPLSTKKLLSNKRCETPEYIEYVN